MNIEHFLINKLVENSTTRPHLSDGVSDHGKCLLMQILYRMTGKEIFSTGTIGRMEPGTVMHNYFEGLLPSGTIIKNEDGIAEYEVLTCEYFLQFKTMCPICGDRNCEQSLIHGELVRICKSCGKLNDYNPVLKRSSIDIVLRNLITNEIEIVDLKSVDASFRKKNPEEYVKTVHIYQVNLYAEELKQLWALLYHVKYHLIYISKANWTDVLWSHTDRGNSAMYNESLLRFVYIDRVYNGKEMICTDDNIFKMTQTDTLPEGLLEDDLNQCKYCDFATQSINKYNHDQKRIGVCLQICNLNKGTRFSTQEELMKASRQKGQKTLKESV